MFDVLFLLVNRIGKNFYKKGYIYVVSKRYWLFMRECYRVFKKIKNYKFYN